MSIRVLTCSMFLIVASAAYAAEVDLEWRQAVSLVKQGQPDFAFANFDLIARTYPESRYARPAEFAQGEYFYMQGQRKAAAEKFRVFYGHHPRSQEALAALAYLYEIARLQSDAAAAAKYRKQLVSSHQANFIFKDRKSYEFTSAFARRHKISFAIDQIEVWVDGKLLVRVPL